MTFGAEYEFSLTATFYIYIFRMKLKSASINGCIEHIGPECRMTAMTNVGKRVMGHHAI